MEDNLIDYLHCEVVDSIVADKSRRAVLLSRDSASTPTEIFYEFDRLMPLEESAILDGHVLAILLYAMSSKLPLRVHGCLSQDFLRNCQELQLAWARWKPDLYKVVDILPDRIVDRAPPGSNKKAISAFSGGVDATFTALRHTRILPDRSRYPIRSLLMVHGFDIELYNSADFQKLVTRIKPLVDELGVDLRVLRTNSRELRLQDWDDSSGLELAACLHMFADEFDYGLIGSTEPYETLVIPWGSSPITDHLMSGSKFSIVHDGAGFSRTEKVAAIRQSETACRTLKVCWAGADQSQNCGRCEKCVRTHMNFLAAGAEKSPPCFPGELDIADIDRIEIHNDVQFNELSSIVAYARSRNLKEPWVEMLEAKIAPWKTNSVSGSAVHKDDPRGSRAKQMLARLIVAMGYEAQAKKTWRQTRRWLTKTLEH